MMNVFPRARPARAAAYRRAPAVTIRWATAEDAQDLELLAELDEAPIPAPPLLLAVVDGELWAAFSPRTGSAIGDPFRPSAEVVDLIRERGRQLSVSVRRRPRLRAMRLLSEPW